MFDIRVWLKNAYIAGVQDGTFSAAYIAEKSVEQLDRGRFTESDLAEISEAIDSFLAAPQEDGIPAADAAEDE